MILGASLQERGALRYTPAGIPALDLVLGHGSVQREAGAVRKVALELKAVALGELVARLDKLEIGARLDAAGFLAAQRNGRGIVFHITELH